LDAASPPVRVSLCLDWATRDPQGQHADWCATMRVVGGLQAKTPAAETERGRPAIQCPCVSCSTINQAPTLVSDGMVFMAAREGGGWKLCDGFFLELFGAVGREREMVHLAAVGGERNGLPRRPASDTHSLSSSAFQCPSCRQPCPCRACTRRRTCRHHGAPRPSTPHPASLCRNPGFCPRRRGPRSWRRLLPGNCRPRSPSPTPSRTLCARCLEVA